MVTHNAVLLLVLAIAEALLLASAAVWHAAGRKRARQALRASEDLYRSLVDACPDAIFHLTLEGTIVTANRQLATLFGYLEVPLGANAIDFVAPEEQASARQQLIALVADGVHRGNEYTCIRADAGRFPAEITTALIRDGEGRPQSVVGLIRDVSRRKQAESAVTRARAFLERLVDALPTPVFVKRRDHRFIMVNDALCTMLGRPRYALLGKSDQELFPAVQAELFVKMDDAVFATGRDNVNEEEISNGAGNMRSIVTRKAVFQDFDGSDVLVGVIDDITERKRTEETLRLSAQVFEHSTEAMFVSDENNVILMVNRAFTTITGHTAAEVVGSRPRILSSSEQPQGFYERMWRSVLEQGQWQGELINRRKNGEIYPAWLNISVMRDATGRIYRHIALFSDITDRKITEERIRFMAQHDVLTGLPNRGLLRDRVEQALRRSLRTNRVSALMMLDLDHFKEVNDSFGHQVGDALLIEVARRLTACVRESDTVSRLGGDEFVVLFAETTTAADAKRVARKILIELARPFLLKRHQVRIGASVGISIFPGDGSDFDSLLRAADEAMYRVKEAGRNNFAFARPLELTA